MDKVKERLSVYIQYLGIANTTFERNCGLGRGLIANKSSSMSCDKLISILNYYPELNVEWVLLGGGLMLKSANKSAKIDSKKHILIEFLESLNKDKDKEIAKLNRQIGYFKNTVENARKVLGNEKAG